MVVYIRQDSFIILVENPVIQKYVVIYKERLICRMIQQNQQYQIYFNMFAKNYMDLSCCHPFILHLITRVVSRLVAKYAVRIFCNADYCLQKQKRHLQSSIRILKVRINFC
jgi:hypothetical protein